MEDDDGAIFTALGLYRGRKGTERIVKAMKKKITSKWEERAITST